MAGVGNSPALAVHVDQGTADEGVAVQRGTEGDGVRSSAGIRIGKAGAGSNDAGEDAAVRGEALPAHLVEEVEGVAVEALAGGMVDEGDPLAGICLGHLLGYICCAVDSCHGGMDGRGRGVTVTLTETKAASRLDLGRTCYIM